MWWLMRARRRAGAVGLAQEGADAVGGHVLEHVVRDEEAGAPLREARPGRVADVVGDAHLREQRLEVEGRVGGEGADAVEPLGQHPRALALQGSRIGRGDQLRQHVDRPGRVRQPDDVERVHRPRACQVQPHREQRREPGADLDHLRLGQRPRAEAALMVDVAAADAGELRHDPLRGHHDRAGAVALQEPVHLHTLGKHRDRVLQSSLREPAHAPMVMIPGCTSPN